MLPTTTERTSQNDNHQEAALLSLQRLRVHFELRRFGFGHVGNIHAVDGVSFDLCPGETAAIVGESGCGKSSLMRAVLGLHRPTGGKIRFQAIGVGDMGSTELKQYRCQVGYIQQDPYAAMAPFMNIERILEEPLMINGVKDQKERLARVHQALEEVKLFPVDDFLPKFPHMLSGGQQQRVVIARAMLLKPRLVVADEPVSMLDASVRIEILKLLRGLQEQRGMAMIYITHDLSTVRYFSQRIFVMYAGQLVEKAPVSSLLGAPLHPYTGALLSATSDPDGQNALMYKDLPPGEPPSLVHPPSGCRFHPRCMQRIPGLCDRQQPPEFQPKPGHQVACWLYQ